MNTKENPHSGHRERLREKVCKNGLKSLAEHEILEYWLTYSIPRKNTNDIAHALLNKFGNINNVINTSFNELVSVKGVGETSALFLSSLGQFLRMTKAPSKTNVILSNVDDCVKYFRANYDVGYSEKLYIVCLNAMGKIIKTEILDGDCNSLVINKQLFTSVLVDPNIGSCVVFHTHPDGAAKPSKEDIAATQTLIDICTILGVWFADHIIFNEKEYYSLLRNTKDTIHFNTNFPNFKESSMRQHANFT